MVRYPNKTFPGQAVPSASAIISVHFLSAVLTTSDRIYRIVDWNRNTTPKPKAETLHPLRYRVDIHMTDFTTIWRH